MQQEKALAVLKSGKNVFLTGSAGTGKTYVLNQYIDFLKERKVRVAVTASTGIAATHMNGLTIHSWAGIGVKEKLTTANLVSMSSKKYLKDHLEKVKVLIIDEISMLHRIQLDLVNQVLQFFQNNTEPFGGIQVVFCGDFFQLPPIGKQGETSRDKFAFMSIAWAQAKLEVCYLTEQFRQADNELNNVLNQIRTGKLSSTSFQYLKAAENNQLAIEEPTKLYTHNVDVDRINSQQLELLSGRKRVFKATTKGNKKLVETLKNSVLASETLELKIGAKVMFVRNNPEKGYVNGSIGEVIGFTDDGIPSVKISYNKKTVKVEKEDWTVYDDTGKTLAGLSQIPLRLAWAITIHKCQGMTLDAAEIDLSKTFENGQGYVALSRLKRLDTLKLVGLNEKALMVDGLAYKADQRFQELSNDTDNNFNLDELELMAKVFVKSAGGLMDKKEITKQRNKLKEKEKGKLSTYATTLIHLKQRASLKEIAAARGLTVGTIASHLIKIRKDYPDEDLNYYRPKNSIMKKVIAAYDTQPKGQPISLNAIYKELGGKVSYDDIKLALAFI